MYIISLSFISIGVINHVIDNHNVIFIICDQIVFQISISQCFLSHAIIQVANSGRLVHIHIIVNHIIVEDIQKDCAIEIDDLTITSAHRASHTIHQIIYKLDFKTVNLWLCSSCSSSKFFIIQNVYDTNIIKRTIKISESQKVIIFIDDLDNIISQAIKNNVSDVNSAKGTSLYTVEFFALSGNNIAHIHKTSNIFVIFDHTTFQNAKDVSLFIAEIVFINNSGAEVHIATIVSHITRFEIPSFFAMFVDQSTRYQAHFISMKNQTIKSI